MKFSIIMPLAPERDCEVKASLENLDFDKKEYEVIIKVGKNPSLNRNNGAKESKGEILCFLDDDAFIENDILKKAENFFKKYNVDILGGPQLTPKDDKYFAKTSGYAISDFFCTSFMSNRYKKGKLNLNADENSLTSAICFVKKEVFDKLNGFNLNLFPGEDPEFFYRAKKQGFKIAYSPEIFIYHRRRPTLKLLWKQFSNYGYTRVKKERKIGNKINILYLLPSVFLIYLILLIPLSLIRIFFILPLIIYILIILISGIKQIIIYKDLKSIFLLPFIYPLIHVSYGYGLIKGLIKEH